MKSFLRFNVVALSLIVIIMLGGHTESLAQSSDSGIDLSGSWHGHMTGNSLQGPETNQWETSFTMWLHDVHFKPKSPHLGDPDSYDMRALAIMHYHESVWSPPPGVPCNTTINLDQRTMVGRIDGGGRTDLEKITPKFSEVEPDGTSTISCPEGVGTHPLYGNVSLGEHVPSAHSPYDIYWEASEDGNTLYLKRSVEKIVLGIHKKTWEIEGVLHRVADENEKFPEDISPEEKVSTDKHTRKTVELPDVGKVTASPNAEFAIEPEPTDAKTGLEQMHGELLHRVKQLDPDQSYEVRTPQFVLGARGTTFFSVVEESRTLVGVSEGSVGVAERGGSKSLVLEEGEMVVSEDGALPTTIMNFSDFTVTYAQVK